MILVLANRYDMAARRLVARWAAGAASLLTPDDLSVAGWQHYLPSDVRATCVVGGRKIPVGEIKGVYTRIACVTERDIPSIRIPDRPYVAGEMTAFLLSWLSDLLCPIINPPTPLCLSGPGWRPEQWAFAAAGLGIGVHPVSRTTAISSYGASPAFNAGMDGYISPRTVGRLHTVTVVGSRAYGPVHDEVADQALGLAHKAGMIFLRVHFDGATPGARFIGAESWPTPDDESADMLMDYLTAGVVGRQTLACAAGETASEASA